MERSIVNPWQTGGSTVSTVSGLAHSVLCVERGYRLTVDRLIIAGRSMSDAQVQWFEECWNVSERDTLGVRADAGVSRKMAQAAIVTVKKIEGSACRANKARGLSRLTEFMVITTETS